MYPSMSTQEKVLMGQSAAGPAEPLNLDTESTTATIRQIARDFIELHRLEEQSKLNFSLELATIRMNKSLRPLSFLCIQAYQVKGRSQLDSAGDCHRPD